MILDLTQGITKTEQYEVFIFPGGEVHFKMDDTRETRFQIKTRINSSDELILLCLVADTLKEHGAEYIEVFLPYMPYQQADRDFSEDGKQIESFSLRTVTNILNSLPVDKYVVFDAHSDVTAGLLKKAKVVDNSDFIRDTINSLELKGSNNLTLLSPDAGAYKKIGKLAKKINFKGEVAAANKYRSISEGTIESLELSKQDFKGADILIVDDICMGGRTFIGLAEKLREKNVGKVYLAVSHGIFNHGLKELNQHFDGIYTTNSRMNHHTDGDFSFRFEKQLNKLHVYPVV